jgi:cytochrome c-type biogenesis protein CcmH
MPTMTATLPELKEQLRQLQALHAAGTLDDAAYDRARAEVERRVVERVAAGDIDVPTPAHHGTRPWRLWATVSVGVMVIATAGYLWTGDPQAAWNAAPPAAADVPTADAGGAGHAMDTQRIEALVGQLTQRLKATPEDAQGWAMLARSLTVLGRHAEALPAYEKARALRGDDATLLADHADAMAMAHGRRIAGEPLALVRRALELDPDSLKALSLAGSEAFERRDYPAALTYWEHARRVAPPGSPYVAPLESGIAEARSLAGGSFAATPAAAGKSAASASAAAAATPRISGTVSLAAALRSRVQPDDTVFIYARAAQGPRMPVAIVRRQVRDLPFDFTLDDSNAMSPSQPLSSLSAATLVARISRSGQAMPQPGDLIGELSPVTPGSSGWKLEISRVVEP